MPNACDYSVARPAPAALAGAQIVGAVRYCVDGSGPAGKAITRAEYQALKAAGLHVALVQEVGPQPALRGAAGGTADAAEAEAVAREVGHDGAIYYVAEDPTRVDRSVWPTVVAYFQAVKQANPQRLVGAYGSQALVAYLQALGLVTFGWMVGPWSSVITGMHLCQRIGGVPSQFANQIDIDIVLADDWGASPRPAPPAPAPQPSGEDMPAPCVFNMDGKPQLFYVSSNGFMQHHYKEPAGWIAEQLSGGWQPNSQVIMALAPDNTYAVVGMLASGHPCEVRWTGQAWVTQPI